MAKIKKEKEVFSSESLKKELENFLFKSPETLEDGTIKTPRYETGIIMLDILLNGGFPWGRVLGFGAEWGVGKTTLLIQACGNIIEKYNKKVYYIDVEGGATYELFEAMGYANLLYHPKTNPDGKFFLLGIETIQDISAVIKKVCQDEDTAIVVIDSDTDVVDGLALEEDDLGTSNKAVGIDARMWSKAAKVIKAVVKKSNACLVIVHQARVDLSGFMPKIVATGGNAMKHMASAEIWGKRKGWIAEGNIITKNKKEAIGAYVSLNTEKNRLTKPFSSVMVPIFFGKGVSNTWAYKEWLETHDTSDTATGEVIPIIKKKGAWYEISLPSGVFRAHGDSEVWKIILDNFDEIKKYVDGNGGFTTSEAEDTYIEED